MPAEVNVPGRRKRWRRWRLAVLINAIFGRVSSFAGSLFRQVEQPRELTT